MEFAIISIRLPFKQVCGMGKILMFASNYHRNKTGLCKTCGKVHHYDLRCTQIKCAYCDSLHRLSQFKEGLCPAVYDQIKYVPLKVAYKCKKCLGLGYYVLRKQVIFEQHEGRYQERLRIWQMDLQRGMQLPRPEKKTIQAEFVENTIKCQDCDSAGVIKRFKFCCHSGCVGCKFEGVVENGRWLQYKIADKKTDYVIEQETSCTICRNVISKDEMIYRLDCEHRFHKECAVQWLRIKKECPVCRKTDFFFPYDNKTVSSTKAKNDCQTVQRERSRNQPKNRGRGRAQGKAILTEVPRAAQISQSAVEAPADVVGLSESSGLPAGTNVTAVRSQQVDDSVAMIELR